MEYTPWSLLVDAGLIGTLLLIGTLVRRWVGLAQRLMLPASVIAGFLGLALGPNVLGVLPFSDELDTYASVLIAVIFACLPLSDEMGLRGFGRGTASFSAYSMAMYTLQVGLGMLLALVLFVPVFDTPDGFGLLLFAGWAGGFGSAAAIGTTFGEAGWVEANSLAFTSATIGLLTGVVGGIVWANWGARRGFARLGSLAEMSESLRSGLVRDPDERTSIGTGTTSASAIEPLGLQVGLVAAVTAAAYGLGEATSALVDFTLPTFILAFLVGLLVRAVLQRTPAWSYTDARTIKSLSGVSTDVLIVCGIASIVPRFVADAWLPLAILSVLGLVFCLVMMRWVAPRVMHGAWFEKALFTWGWATGSVATSIALLRMVDPELDSRTLEDFGLAYLPVVPVETASVALTPLIVIAGFGWAVGAGWTAIGLVALALPFVLGWTRARSTASPTSQ